MKNWKLSWHLLGIRIISFPLKLAFTIFWYFILGMVHSARWLVCGSQEILFGRGTKADIVRLIESTEKLVKKLEE